MDIQELYSLIESLKKENKPENKDLIAFYVDKYKELCKQVGDSVNEQLKKAL